MTQSYDDMLQRAKEETMDVEEKQGERFEPPEAEIQQEGNKARITNFDAITDALRRDPDHVAKYLLRELGTGGEIDDGTLLVNGTIREKLTNQKIVAYVEEYVYCDSCNRPDTQLTEERGVLVLKCEACGTRTPVNE